MEKHFFEDGGSFKMCKASELFNITSNPQLDKDSFVFSDQGKYPYFTRTVYNNGILGYVEYLDEKHKIPGNSLAVGMIGMKFFYMAHDFYAGQFTKTAFPLFEGFNEKVALWFISWFNKSSDRYLGVLVRDFEKLFYETEVLVPYLNGKISVAYMEDYIRLLEARYMHELETYLSVAGFDDCTLTQEEAEAIRRLDAGGVKMEEKRIVDIFDVRNSHNILKSDVVFGSGNTPYVTASEGSNSIVSYIDYDEGMIEKGNSIMIGGKTLVITYQPDDFFSNDSHNLVLRVKEEKGQVEEAQLYMVSALYKSLSHKYSWGNSISNKKIQADTVFLPVNSSHQIDFAFMENYIRAVKKLCVGCLKDAINRGWEREGDT